CEIDILQRLLRAELGVTVVKKLKRNLPKTKRTLQATARRLQAVATRLWSAADAEDAVQEVEVLERNGDWHGAREAYAKVLVLSPSRFTDVALRFAQLLHVMATSSDGDPDACEQVLRQALAGEAATNERAILARLAVLLLQEGREEEALPLLQSAGYQYRLASWIWRCSSAQLSVDAAGFPGCVFDNALPPSLFQRLQQFLAPDSRFWSEHGYNEVTGSGENGYFSYIQTLTGQEQNALDAILRHVWEFLKKGGYFSRLSEAKVAEWWAHKRPHACGHQMHYDSDNEGIGGVRNPICSCVLYVMAPRGIGGPTLVTDQVLASGSLGRRGWFVHPNEGRLAAYEGKYFHGVVPGCGVAPCSEEPLRRITFMIAFWPEIELRPFGADGLAGSSRAAPDPAHVLEVGDRRYTWHQALSLPSMVAEAAANLNPAPASSEVLLPSNAPVWVTLDGDPVQDDVLKRKKLKQCCQGRPPAAVQRKATIMIRKSFDRFVLLGASPNRAAANALLELAGLAPRGLPDAEDKLPSLKPPSSWMVSDTPPDPVEDTEPSFPDETSGLAEGPQAPAEDVTSELGYEAQGAKAGKKHRSKRKQEQAMELLAGRCQSSRKRMSPLQTWRNERYEHRSGSTPKAAASRRRSKEPQKAEKLPEPEATEPDEVETKPKASSKAKAKAKAKAEAKAEAKAKAKAKAKGRAKTETPAAAKTPGTKAPKKDPAEFEPETVRRRLWQDSEDSEESPRKVKASPARGTGLLGALDAGRLRSMARPLAAFADAPSLNNFKNKPSLRRLAEEAAAAVGNGRKPHAKARAAR
ncbi:unnamed protein product, partial [Symbiodinium sp. CCMP2456]